jgi:glycosyltransferase involved in cell wall biosynthesis
MRNVWIFSVFSAPPEYEMRYRTTKMAQELVKGGDRVTIFASSAIHNTDINLIDDESLYRINQYNGVDYVFIRCQSYHTNGADRIWSLVQFYFRLRKVIRHFEAPDVIIAESPYPTVAHSGITIARKYNVPCITEIRDLWPESIIDYQRKSQYNPVIFSLLVLEKWIYKHSSATVFTMPGGRDYILEKGWGKSIDLAHVFHINNGIDIAEFDAESEHTQLKDVALEDESHFKFVYCGSIRQANNIQLVVQGAEELKRRGDERARFIAYGDGGHRQQLEEYCQAHGLSNVEFKGFIEKRYVPAITTHADVNVLSYEQVRAWKYGGSQNKLFEYLASGKPILSTIQMSYDPVKEHDCGIVLSAQEPEIFADAVQEFMDMPREELQAMGRRSRHAAFQYDYPILAGRLKAIIEQFSGNKTPVRLVSLCVIAYNEESYLEKLFEAIEAQDYPHAKIELILVDGASSDNTKSIMQKYAAEERSYRAVQVLDNPKRVQPHGWNTAILGSSGDAIVRVDAHASIPPDFVRHSIETLEKGEDVCGGPWFPLLDEKTPWKQALLAGEQSIFGSSIAIYRRNAKAAYVPSISHGAYRREVFDKAGLFDGRLLRTEDNEMHYRIRKAGYRIKLNPQIHSYQYVRSTFRSMMVQKYKNGYWIGRTLFISPYCLGPHHLVPGIFVVVALAALIVGLTATWWPALLLAAAYLVADVGVSLFTLIRSKKRNWRMLALPVVFISMHIAYGLGTVVGIVAGFCKLFARASRSAREG